MELVSSTSANQTASLIGSNVATSIDSVWTLVVLAITIPLAFYIINRIKGIFPKGK